MIEINRNIRSAYLFVDASFLSHVVFFVDGSCEYNSNCPGKCRSQCLGVKSRLASPRVSTPCAAELLSGHEYFIVIVQEP